MSAKGYSAQIQAVPQNPALTQVSSTNVQPVAMGQPEWMYTPQQVTLDSNSPGVCLPQILLRGLMDTGADVTVISHSAWPPTWPKALLGQAI
ncbi:hypothetical protein Nmel_005120 [Mimus melanotis]